MMPEDKSHDLPDVAIDRGRSVRAWLKPDEPRCRGCFGTGFGIDTQFEEACVHCGGEGTTNYAFPAGRAAGGAGRVVGE